MAGISDAAVEKLNSQNKFNGGSELEEDYGVNLYSTFYRRYDPQIGRFSGVDCQSEASAGISVYQFGGNNPVSMNDPLGDIQTAGYYSHPPGYRDYSLKEPNGSYTDVNGNSWHGNDPLEGASQWMDSGDDGGGGGVSGEYSEFWNSVLTLTNEGLKKGDEINDEVYNQNESNDQIYSGNNILLATYLHYQLGDGTPFHVSTEALDFSNISQEDLVHDLNGNVSVNLFKLSNLNQTGLALGKISLNDEGNNWYTINPDRYDFNIERNNLVSVRNFATALDFVMHVSITSIFFGGSYNIYFHGSIYINPQSIPVNHP